MPPTLTEEIRGTLASSTPAHLVTLNPAGSGAVSCREAVTRR
jgi:hypothetical protein